MPLPENVVYCRRCVMSNQRPSSRPEHLHGRGDTPDTLHLDEEGVCDACRTAERKAEIDWAARRRELEALCDRFRRDDGRFDCIVPGSGGKDSVVAAITLERDFGMHPLCVTWPPAIYTDYGRRNWDRWAEKVHVEVQKPKGDVHAYLTRLAIENIGHPFQPFILGQKFLGPRAAVQHDIPLVVYGENEAEYGNPRQDNDTSRRRESFYALDMHPTGLRISGASVGELTTEHGLTMADLNLYLPESKRELDRVGVEVHYMGYYGMPRMDAQGGWTGWGGWEPQEAYYFAKQTTGFERRPFRTSGTFSVYNSLDDAVDDAHYHFTLAKFGLSRANYDASQEIRNGHRTREEGVALVKRYGMEPPHYLEQICEYTGLSIDEYWHIWEQNKSAHLWDGDALRHPVWDE